MSARVGVTHSDDYNADAYVAALEAAGITPVLISPKFPRGLEDLDGLVLCGGTDVNPDLYGETLHPEAAEPEKDLDELELRLLREALEKDMPVLAICRGMQLFNVAHGGTLDQHISNWPEHRRYDKPKPEAVHSVLVPGGTKLAEIFGADLLVNVNSRHHQAVKAVGEGLTVSAQSADGLVEGLERGDRKFAVAVQWHPENQAAFDPVQARLFAAFGKALPNGLH